MSDEVVSSIEAIADLLNEILAERMMPAGAESAHATNYEARA